MWDLVWICLVRFILPRENYYDQVENIMSKVCYGRQRREGWRCSHAQKSSLHGTWSCYSTSYWCPSRTGNVYHELLVIALDFYITEEMEFPITSLAIMWLNNLFLWTFCCFMLIEEYFLFNFPTVLNFNLYTLCMRILSCSCLQNANV